MIVSARAALLQVLVEGEGYAAELVERVRVRTGGRVSFTEGAIYPALESLEREDLVYSREVPPPDDRGGRPRRYYKINARGRRAAAVDRAAVTDLFCCRGSAS